MTLRDLRPGDYAATLRFTANNSEIDDAQKLQINIHVRDSVWLAVVWMIIALIISFIGTKVLTSQRRRASLLQQIQQIRAQLPQWFSSLGPSPPLVVRVSAGLHQAERLSRRFWLTSPDLIETKVNNVSRMLNVLDRVHQLRQQLEKALDPLVFRRAVRALDRVVSPLETSPLTDSALQSINTDLDAFKDWLSDDKFAHIFWTEIRPDLHSLRNEVNPDNIPAIPGAPQLAADLKNKLVNALKNPPATRDDVEDVYRGYAKLRILWDHREHPEDLEPLIQASTDIYTFFEKADGSLWQRIKGKALTIRLPNTNGLEAYQILPFSVETEDSAIKRSYLFRHKIEYKWKFELPKSWGREIPPLEPSSLGPSVSQYFPRPGKIKVSAKLVYGNDKNGKGVTADKDLSISVSSDFRGYKILAWTEVASWLIAVIVAIATGLFMFYYKNPSWGTHQDYLTLFLWGIGVDQGKNFLQALQAYSAQPVTPSSGSHS